MAGELSRQFYPFYWLTQPSITVQVSVASTYELSQHVRNQHNLTLTYGTVGTLPTGMTLNTSTGRLTYTGASAANATVQFSVTSAVFPQLATSSSIVIAVNPAPTTNQPPVILTIPNIPFTLGTEGTFSFAPYVSDLEGDPYTTQIIGSLPTGCSYDPSTKVLSYDGSGVVSHTTTNQLDASNIVIATARVDIAPIPEIVFVQGYAETDELGPFILDPQNPWTPGDVNNTSGWTSVAGRRPALGGNPPAGVTYDPITARLTYDGQGPKADATVQLSYGSQVRSFRIRVLAPTVIWGRDASSIPNIWAVNPLRFEPPTTSFFTALNSTSDTNRSDDNPNVFLITGGSYSEVADGNINGRPRKFLYLLGEPGDRPVFNSTFEIGWTFYETQYLKNLEMVTSCWSYNSCDGTQDIKLYVTKVYNHDQQLSASGSGPNAFGFSNAEGDGGSTFRIIDNKRVVHVWNSEFVGTGGFDTEHVFYVHGRPGGEAYFTNNDFRGANGGQQIKTTLPRLYLIHNRMWAMRDKVNFNVGMRAHNLVDTVNCAELVIYGNEFAGAFDATAGGSDSHYVGVQNGLIFLRARREMLGADVPTYPNLSYTDGTTTFLTASAPGSTVSPATVGGAFPGNTDFTWVQGFDGTTTTFKSDAFWSAVNAYDMTNALEAEASPYAFKHYISHNTFEWVGGNEPRDAIRNDGTYPRSAATLGGPSTFRETHPSWTERSVDFLANNRFIGYGSDPINEILNYEDFETGSNGTATTGVIKWPRTGTRLTNPTQFPQYLDINSSNDFFGTGVSQVTLPSWFKIGGTPAAATVLSQAAASLTSGFSAPLDIPSLGVESARINAEDPLAYPDTSSAKRTWHWGSKAGWDSVQQRVVMINGPHIELDNPDATLISVYDEAENDFWVGEDPLGGWSGAHLFDTFAIDVPGRRWFKWSNPYAPSGPYIQPQLLIGSLDFTNKASVDNGGSVTRTLRSEFIPSIIGNDTTAPAIDYFPGVGLCLFHKNSLYVIDVDSTTATATAIDEDLPVDTLGGGVYAFHNVGHYNPGADVFVFGGGSYDGTGASNLQWFKMDRNRVVTQLDPSPVVMSVNTNTPAHKACACPYPGTNKSIFFHNNRNIYILDPTANTGAQWATLANAGDPDNGTTDDRWCASITTHGVVMLGHYGQGGTSKIRLFRLP